MIYKRNLGGTAYITSHVKHMLYMGLFLNLRLFKGDSNEREINIHQTGDS